MKRLTNGELRTFKRCRRKWWLGWNRRLRPIAAQVVGAAPLGTRVHAALATYYAGRGDPLAFLDQLLAEDSERLGGATEDLLKEHELARVMVEGYIEWLAETGSDQGLEVIGVEERVEVPFPGVPGVHLMGKLDLRIRRELDGARLFLDHKTVGSITDSAKRLHQDEQMLHYHMLERLAAPDGEHADGALYNMLRKVKRTARSTPPFYERVEVRHNIHELRSYFGRVWGTLQTILQVERHIAQDPASAAWLAFPTPTKDCSWDCEFFGVCPMFDDGSDAEGMLAAYYQAKDPLDRYETVEEL